jgi:hypothetical protein
VGFRDQKLIRRLKVETRLNAIVNRLNATRREEAHPDLAAEREAYDKEACARLPLRCNHCLSGVLARLGKRLLLLAQGSGSSSSSRGQSHVSSSLQDGRMKAQACKP